MLTGFTTTGVPAFTLNNVTVDGLGRLKNANETITDTNGNTVAHSLYFEYDKRSQLIGANITNISGAPWTAQYSYNDNGDMVSRTVQANQTDFTYSGNQMITAGGNNLSYDENGQLTTGIDTSLVWNWDGKLRSATKDDITINLRYDPAGNRITKDVNDGQTITARKYIVDIIGDLPVILLVLDDSQNVLKKYIYANSQIVAQQDVTDNNKLYFYLHDRLGSVRQLINTSGNVVRLYTYNPFGETLETDGSFDNPFKFSGQFFDNEIDEYYLRARQYDPYISRFTSRDPVFGEFKEPLSLHVYLYCINNPINQIDPWGLQSESKEMNALLRSAIFLQVAIDWELETAVSALATVADISAYYHKGNRTAFVESLLRLFTERRGPFLTEHSDNPYSIYELRFGQSGFKQIYRNTYNYREGHTMRNQPDQVRHFVAALGAGYYYGSAAYPVIWWRDTGDTANRIADRLLGYKGVELGSMIRGGWPPSSPIGFHIGLENVGNWIRGHLAE